MFLIRIHLRKELKEGTTRFRSSVITLDSKSSPELERTANYFSNYFGLPVLSIDEVVKEYLVSMHFSIDSSDRFQITFILLGQMIEIGPRLTISRLIWEVI